SLAHDLGMRLGVGAHLAALRRTASAGLTLADAIPLAVAERSREEAIAAIVPLGRMRSNLSSVVLTEDGVERATHGRATGAPEVTSGPWPGIPPVRLFDQWGQLI